MKAIALDDEPLALQVIEDFCSRTNDIELEKVFTRPSEALKYLRKFPVDVIFLDINMPSMSGLKFHEQMPHKVWVIFTTAHSEYAVTGFDLNATDYLLKPFSFERFLKAIEKVKEHHKASTRNDTKDNHLLIRADYSLHKITYSDILMIEGLDDYIKIHLPGKSPLVARMTMKNILDKLPENEFIRIHRSFTIPVSKIESIRNKNVTIAGREIPIGSSYEENFYLWIKNNKP